MSALDIKSGGQVVEAKKNEVMPVLGSVWVY